MTIDPLLLAKQLIACNDLSDNKNEKAIDLIQNILENFGFFCKKILFSKTDHPTVANLYAHYDLNKNTTNKTLAFAGHTDVVGVDDKLQWLSDPFIPTIMEENLYGRGSVDMKTSIACFIAASLSFIKNSKKSGRISFLITNNEEGDSTNGTPALLEWIEKNRLIPNYCIVGEPTSENIFGDTIKIGRRGSINFEIKIFGKSGHVAYPNLADNPISSLISLLLKIKNLILDEGNNFFQPSNIEITSLKTSSDTVNVIPSYVVVTFNIRFNNINSPEKIIKIIKEQCCQNIKKYELKHNITALPFLNEKCHFTSLLSDVIQSTINITPKYGTSGGTSDARYITKYCHVAEFGPLSSTAHQANEHIPIKDLYNLYNIYKNYIEKFFNNFA